MIHSIEQIEIKRRRLRNTTVIVAVFGLVYLIALITGFSYLRAPLPGWLPLLLLPIPAIAIAVPILRTRANILAGDAARAQIAAAIVTIDDLQRDLDN